MIFLRPLCLTAIRSLSHSARVHTHNYKGGKIGISRKTEGGVPYLSRSSIEFLPLIGLVNRDTLSVSKSYHFHWHDHAVNV